MPKRSKGPYLVWRRDNQCWSIRWFERGRKRERSTGTGDREAAQKALVEFLVAKEPTGPRDPSQASIADVLAVYLEEKAIHAKDATREAVAVEALIPFWGRLKVSDIRQATCRDYMAKRGVSPSTVRRELATLSSAISYSYKAGYLTASVYVWKPPQADPKDRWLTRKEAAALLHAALYPKVKRGGEEVSTNRMGRAHLPLFILIGLYTAARKEAILSLRWSQVDLDRGLIDFNQKGRERTTKGRPIIPIPRRLMTFLKLAAKRGKSDTSYLITYNGKPIKDVKKAFKRAALQAGLDDVSPHTLRHTSASWMVQKGVPFPKVARYLGHKDSRTTERVYAHHAPDYLREAADAFD